MWNSRPRWGRLFHLSHQLGLLRCSRRLARFSAVSSAGMRDRRIVIAFDVGEREAELNARIVAVRAAILERRALHRRRLQVVANEVTESLTLEEELATTLFDDLRLYLRLRSSRKRWNASPRVQRVDDGERRCRVAGSVVRFGANQLCLVRAGD